MLLYITLGCVLIAWSVAWMASRRHVAGIIVVGICAAFGTLVLQRDALAYFGYTVPAWWLSITLVFNTLCIACFAWYVWMTTTDVVALAGLIVAWRRMFADSRRRSSVRADVRRAVKQYSVEVG